MTRPTRYVLLWEFRSKLGMEEEFEKAYGPDGLWIQFFRTGEGYIGTNLYRDTVDRRRFVTEDTWISREAYDRFREQHHEEYRRIDEICEGLTDTETNLGSFMQVS